MVYVSVSTRPQLDPRKTLGDSTCKALSASLGKLYKIGCGRGI
jgi:hypothetical protein